MNDQDILTSIDVGTPKYKILSIDIIEKNLSRIFVWNSHHIFQYRPNKENFLFPPKDWFKL